MNDPFDMILADRPAAGGKPAASAPPQDPFDMILTDKAQGAAAPAASQPKASSSIARSAGQAVSDFIGKIPSYVVGTGETALQAVSGAGALLIGDVVGAGAALREGEQVGAEAAANIKNQLTYQPRTQGGREISAGMQTYFSPIAWAGRQAGEFAEGAGAGPLTAQMANDATQAYLGSKVPAVVSGVAGAAAHPINTLAATPRAIWEAPGNAVRAVKGAAADVGEAVANPLGNPATGFAEAQRANLGYGPNGAAAAPYGSVGASAVSPAAAAATASPELRAAVSEAAKNGKVNPDVVGRHLDAEQVGTTLSPGQATRDPTAWADEWNKRTDDVNFRASQKQALVDKVNAVDDAARPDLYTTDKVGDGRTAITALEVYDTAKNAEIRAAYKAVEDANNGVPPVDSGTLLQNVNSALSQKLLSKQDPGGQLSELTDLARRGGMTMENYLNMRQNLGAVARKPSTPAEGAAASVMIDELEKLPLASDAAENVRALADTARSLARTRFEEMRADPAYDAVVNGKAAPETFSDKYIIGAGTDQLAALKAKLGAVPDMPEAPQVIPTAGIRYIKEGSIKGPPGEERFVSQDQFNKRLGNLQLGGKANLMFDPEHLHALEAVGRVGHYIDVPPPGAVINNSGTATVLRQWAQNTAANSAEMGVNVAAHGFPLGTIIRKGTETVTGHWAAKARTKPYQGMNYQKPVPGQP